MLLKTFEGIEEGNADFKTGNLMSPREQAVHLCTCYMAAKDLADGSKPNWKAYEVEDPRFPAVLERLRLLRQTALESFGSDDESIKHADEFLVGHDHYHIGQMCAVRLAMDPSWDPYCIYGL